MAVKYLKRKSAMSNRKVYRRKSKRGPKKSLMGVKNMRAVVNKVLARKIETKQSTNIGQGRYQEILNNSFISIDNEFLKTTQGTADPMAGNTANRIGDEINLKGISLKFMLEMNERFGDVTARIMVVRAARGDTPSTANLFVGLSVNKMMDRINSERYTVIAQKYVHLKVGNQAAGLLAGEQGLTAQPSGVYLSGNIGSQYATQRGTRIVSMYLPGRKFGRNGIIRYENGGQNVKFFDYYVLVYAYANYSTHLPGGTVQTFNICAVADYVKTMYYTDA